MKTKIFFFLFLTLSYFINAQNQSNASIYGHIINKKTNETLPNITILLKGTTINTNSDANGNYKLTELPTGNFIVETIATGYKTSQQSVEIANGQNQEVDFSLEEDEVMIETIVVSSDRTETKRKDASNVINIISPKLLETTNSVCLAQGLSFQPGLRVEVNCQNCGQQQVRIDGLDGNYSQILIDSRPVFSALANVYAIEQIPTNMIQRVEIVRGGGSALFGSNAIGGVINIITKEPDGNSVTVSNTSELIGGKSADINSFFNASIVSDNRKTGIAIFGSTRNRNPYDANGDGFSEIGKLTTHNLGFSSFLKTSNYSKLYFDYHNLYEFRRGGNDFNLPPQKADICEEAEHFINTGSLNFNIFSKNNKHNLDIYSSAQIVNRDNYAGTMQDTNAFGKTNGYNIVSGIQYKYSMRKLIFMPSDFILGAEYNYDRLHDEILGYNRIIDQIVNTKSIFLQNEWKNQKLNILIGLRIDKHNLINEPIISPRINLRFNITKNLIFRASYSTGFRAPQVYEEDLHGSAIGGEISYIQNSKNLKPEQSQSYNASIDFEKSIGEMQMEILLEGFYTNLKNVFILQNIGTDLQNNLIFERVNGSGAVVQGLNFELKIVPLSQVQIQLGTTFQKSLYDEPQTWSENLNIAPTKQMFRTPNAYGFLTTNFKPSKNFDISVTGNYTGSMFVQHFAGYIAEDKEVTTPSFFDLNTKFAYNFTLFKQTKIEVNAGVQNIFNSYQKDFDKGVNRDAAYIYGPTMPRTFFAGIKMSL